jgi:hypothetical protein
MARSVTGDFKERMSIEMELVRAKLIELRAKARRARLDGKADYRQAIKALDERRKDLAKGLSATARSGKQAGHELTAGLEKSFKELRRAVDRARARF